MKKLKLFALATLFVLTACAPGKHLHVTNAIVNFGDSDLGAEMKNRHLIAMVAFDEVHASAYNRQSRAILYVQGVVEGTPEYRYRVARLNMGQLKGAAWYSDGQFLWSTAALVPDHLERLRDRDLVELRQVSGNRAMENFSTKFEGNVVTRVLCRSADPGYKKCAAALPQLGKYGAQGPTGTPYPASVKGYGFTFTPAYDEKGALLRPLAEYTPK